MEKGAEMRCDEHGKLEILLSWSAVSVNLLITDKLFRQ